MSEKEKKTRNTRDAQGRKRKRKGKVLVHTYDTVQVENVKGKKLGSCFSRGACRDEIESIHSSSRSTWEMETGVLSQGRE
jgi:hypothetical protein